MLEALAATGLRSVRYLKEVAGISCLVANDLDEIAVEQMRANFEYNQCNPSQYEVTKMDAVDLMLKYRLDRRTFDVIDLDPYGTALPFLDGALHTVTDDGLLCLTFTDMAVLCSRQPQVSFYRYGASPLGKPYCHEQALRMVLYTINSMATKLGKRVEPMLSLSVDFYIRLFLRVKHSPQDCHESLAKYSNIAQCTFCESFYLQPLGEVVPRKPKKTKA